MDTVYTKKMIFVAILGIGILVWQMRAMEEGQKSVTLQTNDGREITISKEKAILFGTIKDLLVDTEGDATIPLKNVSFDALRRLLDDVDGKHHEVTLSGRIEDLKAADYLGHPKLVQSYAQEIAPMLMSDVSLESLKQQDAAYIALINTNMPDLKSLIYTQISDIDLWYDAYTLRHDKVFMSAIFSSDSKKVMAVSDKTVKIITQDANKEWDKFENEYKDQIKSAVFSTDGREGLIIADSAVIIHEDAGTWDSSTLYNDEMYGSEIKTAAFSPNGKKLFALGKNGQMNFFIKEGTNNWQHYPIADPNTDIKMIVFSPDNKWLYVIKTNQSYLVLAGRGETWTHRDLFSDHFECESARFSPDSQKILMTSSQRVMLMVKAVDGKWHFKTFHGSGRAEFSPNSEKMVLVFQNRIGLVSAVATPIPEVQYMISFRGSFYSTEFSPDSKKIVTAWGNAARIGLDVNDKEKEHTIQHGAPVYSAVFSPDSKKVVTASADKTAKIVWQDENGQWQEHVILHDGPVRSAVFSSDGKKVVTASSDGTAKIVWQDESGQWQEYIIMHDGPVRSAAFSPDSKKVATVSLDHTVKVTMLLPADTLDQLLFVQLLRLAKRNNQTITADSGSWMRRVWDSYNVNDQAVLRSFFAGVLVVS